ncbi:HvfC/BufC N-terminal domain-containing protein [Spartinivicinus ruber]|uniref:HvfC/BufC N-terminal domain-containing protein n=1 Tax=Spartinivicinus ruber TaxID=2683272 RepID=UPI0013D5AA3C|nr:DNA-binding domain-containing protein [Spartinivicinus ruber]
MLSKSAKANNLTPLETESLAVNPPPPESLMRLQSWFLRATTTPGGINRGLVLANHQYELNEQCSITHSNNLTPETRLNIYAQGYVLRLLECLRADFPALCKVMGADLFDFFAKAYIWKYPSTSHTLFNLGGQFADFLLQSQAARNKTLQQSEMLFFPVELARFERARTEVIRAPGLEQLQKQGSHFQKENQLLSLLMETAVLDSHAFIQLTPCTRLLNMNYPMIAIWNRINNEQPFSATEHACKYYIAITRVQYRVTMYELEQWQYQILNSTQERRKCLECVELSQPFTELSKENHMAQVHMWLPIAKKMGLVTY